MQRAQVRSLYSFPYMQVETIHPVEVCVRSILHTLCMILGVFYQNHYLRCETNGIKRKEIKACMSTHDLRADRQREQGIQVELQVR